MAPSSSPPPTAPLPMFPLGSVLLPGSVLPLNIFEPRYRQLATDCLAGTAEFGVVLIARGSEVGGGEVRTDVGTLARIVAAQPFEDGRWELVAVGTRRIRVTRWLDDDPYPRAEVEDWDDPIEAAPLDGAGWTHLQATARRVAALVIEAGAGAELLPRFADDPRLGTFEVAAASPLGALDRQRVLSTEGSAARAALLEDLLRDAAELLEAGFHAPGFDGGFGGDEGDDPSGGRGDLP